MKFRFRPALTAATLAAFAALCSLGAWQLQRLEWKKSLIAKTEARLALAPISIEEALARVDAGEDMEYQPVFATGVYRSAGAATVFSTHEGKAGVLVFAPLDLRDAVIFVNRGFVPQDLAEAAAQAAPPAAPVRVEGLLRRAEEKRGLERLLAPKDQPTDNLYFTRDPRLWAGGAASPFYIDSFGRENEGDWPKGGLTRVEFPNRHLEYALTWFGLAGALIAVYLAFSLRRG
jgi:surfeit locus 1 family protein